MPVLPIILLIAVGTSSQPMQAMDVDRSPGRRETVREVVRQGVAHQDGVAGEAVAGGTNRSHGGSFPVSFESHSAGSPPAPAYHAAAPGAVALPKQSERATRGKPENSRKLSNSRSVFTAFSALAVVLGLFFAVAWFARRNLPSAAAPLPPEVVQVLGRAPLAGKHQLHLIRLGKKLVLVSVVPGGVETITEITETAEVDRLGALCQQQQRDSATATFRQMLSQLSSQPAAKGFFASSDAPDLRETPAPPSGTAVKLEGEYA